MNNNSLETGMVIFQQRMANKHLIEKTASYDQSSIASTTRKNYNHFWEEFDIWCLENALRSMPTSYEIISLYITNISEKSSLSAISCSISAIKKVHQMQKQLISGEENLLKRVRAGIIRQHPEKNNVKQAKALTVIELAIICADLPNDIMGIRDRTILCVGFFAALRRSEIVFLNWDNIEFDCENGVTKGATITLLQSKGCNHAVKLYISKTNVECICPVTLLLKLREHGSTGAIFKSIRKSGKISEKRMNDHNVSLILKKYFGERYSGHSLRRGLITELANKNVPIHMIQKLSRHKDLETLVGYMEVAEGYSNSSGKLLNT